MSTLILTRSNTTYTPHDKISLHHNWDISAKPFIPKSYDVVGPSTSECASSKPAATATMTSSPPRVAAAAAPPAQQQRRLQQEPSSKNIEISKNYVGNNAVPDYSVSPMRNRATSSTATPAAAARNVHMGNQFGGICGISGNSSNAVVAAAIRKHSSKASSASSTSTTTPHSSLSSTTPPRAAPARASPLRPPSTVSLCEKPAKKTSLMSTTDYFMERWNKKAEITSVTHALLEKKYLKSQETPKTTTVPSIFGRNSPYPPVLINQLPSLMTIWKPHYENISFTAGILGAHPEFAIQIFRHD